MAKSFFNTLIHNKCPRCGEGDIFEHKNPYRLRKLMKMHTHCSACNFKYEREIGFFYGAMYVSYGINAFIFTVLYAALEWFGPADLNVFLEIGIISGVMILFVPITFQWARRLWLLLFGS